MKLKNILEDIEIKRLAVVYGGRFQPFHLGHYHAYKWLCKKFGEANVWIATSTKTNFNPSNGEISPFTFKEKKEIIVSLYNVSPRRIIECKNPAFKPVEVFEQYKELPIVYVAGVGAKDEARYRTGSFFRQIPLPFHQKNLEELATLKDDVGYYVVVPMSNSEVTGTIVRDELSQATGDKREALFKKFFGRYDSMIDSLITAKLKTVKDTA